MSARIPHIPAPGYALISTLITLTICAVALATLTARTGSVSAAARAAAADVETRWAVASVQSAVEPQMPTLVARLQPPPPRPGQRTAAPGDTPRWPATPEGHLAVRLGNVTARAWAMDDSRKFDLASLRNGVRGNAAETAELVERLVTGQTRGARVRPPRRAAADGQRERDAAPPEAVSYADVFTGLRFDDMVHDRGGVARRLIVHGKAAEAEEAQGLALLVRAGRFVKDAPPANAAGRARTVDAPAPPADGEALPSNATPSPTSPAPTARGPHSLWLRGQHDDAANRPVAVTLLFGVAAPDAEAPPDQPQDDGLGFVPQPEGQWTVGDTDRYAPTFPPAQGDADDTGDGAGPDADGRGSGWAPPAGDRDDRSLKGFGGTRSASAGGAAVAPAEGDAADGPPAGSDTVRIIRW